MITGIIVALPEELSTLTPQKIASGSSAFIANNCLVALSGTGPENARKAAQQLIELGAQRLLSWGCAGALDVTLKPGTLCIPAMLQSQNGRQATAEQTWRKQVYASLDGKVGICGGKLVESAHIIVASAEKQQLGANYDAQLVDMESCACAEIARQANIPFLAIRAIADPASMNLPQAITVGMQENGQVAINKILRRILRHPGEVMALIKLGIHFQAARNTLRGVSGVLQTILATDNFESTSKQRPDLLTAPRGVKY